MDPEGQTTIDARPKIESDLEDDIVRLFRSRTSVCMLMEGRRETGKSDMSLLIAEICKKHDLVRFFATNIKIYSSPFHIEPVGNLRDLESWSQNNKGKKLFILDEAGKSARRRTPMSSLNISLLDDLQILRKYKLSIIFTFPAEKYIDGAVLGTDVVDVVIEKPNYKNPRIARYVDVLENEGWTYYDIPPTKVKFDTWDIATFVKEGPSKKPKFKDKDLADLWEWSHGKGAEELGLHRQQIHRLTMKFIKEVLEKDSTHAT